MQKTICRRNNGCILAKVEQLQEQWQKISEKWKLHPKHLYDHFYSEDHNGFLGNVSISSIDKTDGFQPKKGKVTGWEP